MVTAYWNARHTFPPVWHHSNVETVLPYLVVVAVAVLSHAAGGRFPPYQNNSLGFVFGEAVAHVASEQEEMK